MLFRQKTRQSRSMTNDPGLYQGAVSGLAPFLSCVHMPKGRNAIFGTDDLNDGMMRAAVANSSVGGCAGAAKAFMGGTVPSYRWYASRLRTADRAFVATS